MPYGVSIQASQEYATMAITQAAGNSVPLVGTGSILLVPPVGAQVVGSESYSGYKRVPGFVLERAKGLSVVAGEIVVAKRGVYVVSVGWGSFQHSLNNSTVGFLLAVTRGSTITFSQRPTSHRVANLGDLSNVSGGGSIELEAGDKLSVWVASDITGAVTIANANVTCHGLDLG